MSQQLSPFTPKKYSLKLVELLWNETLYTKITNTDYEGEIKKAGDRVVVRTAQKLTLSAYTKGMTLVAQDLNPTSEELIVDQQYYFKFIVDDVDKLQNDIDTINTEASGSKRDISELIDTDILGYAWKQVDYRNAIGTNYTTGTVTVTVTTGAVVGSGTTFTSAMVGKPFLATGHTTGYRVKTFTNSTTIVIEDMDSSGYTGGAINAGATYTVYAGAPIVLTKSNIYAEIVALRTALSKRLTPKTGRYLVINADVEGIILNAPEFIPAVGEAYSSAIKQGMIGKIAGFDIYTSELVAGDNTAGYKFIAGDKAFIAFAMQILDVVTIPSSMDPNSFVSTCKGLVTWGRKVFAGNRGRGAYLTGTI